jgi:glycosyltransferase involved in cell wall biosynthesis
MRIAFYAPMKAPTHRTPSGDRTVARLLMRALEDLGHRVHLASGFRAYDGTGDPARQARLATRGTAIANRLIETWRDAPPDAWLTYHVYHKAPDYLGPRVADAFGLPYLAVEPSVAMKQKHGPWAPGFAAAAQALARADALLPMTPEDAEGLADLGLDMARVHALAPFLDTAPYRPGDRLAARRRLAARFGLNPDDLWLATVAMMRPGDKLASYRRLAAALALVPRAGWSLLVAGDGPCRGEVEALYPERTVFAGALREAALPALYRAADLFVWPAVNEAYGMALLAAQASGLPVVAGRERGVPLVVADGLTGILTPPGDDRAFAGAVTRLLGDPERRAAMAAAARTRVGETHSLAAAGTVLARVLAEVTRP